MAYSPYKFDVKLREALTESALEVGTSAVVAKVGASNQAGRQVLIITPTDGKVWWGSASVTTANGQPLDQGESARFDVTNSLDIYLISAGTVDVRVTEGK